MPLGNLPPELQRMVVEELRIPPLPVGTPRSLNTEFTEARADLLSLCLTSHYFLELAEPLLYESIALTKEKQFVLLLNSLLANRDRRTWIRSIACPMCIMDETNPYKTLAPWNQLIAPRKEKELDQREERALQLAGLGLDHILEHDRWINDQGLEESGCGLREDSRAFCDKIMAIILCLTTRLEDILLQIPTDKESLGGLDNLARALHSGAYAPETGVLQSLRSVRLQPTRFKAECAPSGCPWAIEPQDVEPGRDPGFGIDPLRLDTFEIQNVDQVELCGDNGVWFRLLKADLRPWTDDTLPLDLKRFRSLKSLKLYESRTIPSYLRYLLEEAHSLETFHYTTRQQEWRQEYWCPEYADYAFMPLDFFSINEALWSVRKTVKELALGSVQRPWAQSEEEYRDIELVVVLNAFERLTHLSIDIRWLIPVDLTEEVAINPLFKRLPRSIEELHLTEAWTKPDLHSLYSFPGIEIEAMTWLQHALCTLLVEVDEDDGKGLKLAHLRKVTLKAVPAFHPDIAWKSLAWESEADDVHNFYDFPAVALKTDEGMEQMKSIFARFSVEFNIEWMDGCTSFSPSPGDPEGESVESSTSQ